MEILREDVTLGLAILGISIGIFNTWRSFRLSRTRLKIECDWVFDVPGVGYKAFCVTVRNCSGFDIVVESISFHALGKKGRISYWMNKHAESAIPRKVAGRSSQSFILSPHFHKDQHFDQIHKVRVETGDGEVRTASCWKAITSPLREG